MCLDLKHVCIVLLPAIKIQLMVVNFQDTMLVWLIFSALLSYFLAQGKGPDEISQTTKCADSPGLPQTKTGTWVSVCLCFSVFLSFCLSVSVYLSLCLCVSLSLFLPVSVSLSVCPSLCFCLSVSLTVSCCHSSKQTNQNLKSQWFLCLRSSWWTSGTMTSQTATLSWPWVWSGPSSFTSRSVCCFWLDASGLWLCSEPWLMRDQLPGWWGCGPRGPWCGAPWNCGFMKCSIIKYLPEDLCSLRNQWILSWKSDGCMRDGKDDVIIWGGFHGNRNFVAFEFQSFQMEQLLNIYWSAC